MLDSPESDVAVSTEGPVFALNQVSQSKYITRSLDSNHVLKGKALTRGVSALSLINDVVYSLRRSLRFFVHVRRGYFHDCRTYRTMTDPD